MSLGNGHRETEMGRKRQVMDTVMDGERHNKDIETTNGLEQTAVRDRHVNKGMEMDKETKTEMDRETEMDRTKIEVKRGKDRNGQKETGR